MRLPVASVSGFVNTIRSPAEADGSPLALDSGAWSTKANVEPLFSSLNARVVGPCAEAAEPSTSPQQAAARVTRPRTRGRAARGETGNMRYLLVAIRCLSLRCRRPRPPGADVPYQPGMSRSGCRQSPAQRWL